MEALTIEAGRMPTMFLNTDKVARGVLTEVPEEYLRQESKFMTEWIRHVDAWIRLPGLEDWAATREGVPESKLSASRQSGQSLWNALNDMKERVIWVNLPSRVAAEKDGVDFSELEEMHWASMEANSGCYRLHFDWPESSGPRLERYRGHHLSGLFRGSCVAGGRK
jgi:hypothetical protein